MIPLLCCSQVKGASLVAQMVKNLPAMQETWVSSMGQEDPLEKEMATCSGILAWRNPWTEKPDGLQSMGSQRVRHDWATNTHTHTHTHTHRSKQSHVYYDCNCLLVWKDMCLPWCEVLEQEMNASLCHVLPCLPLLNKLQTVSRLGPIPSGCPVAIKWLGIVHAISEWFVFLQ